MDKIDMKNKNVFSALLLVFLGSFSTINHADITANSLWSDYTTSKDCGAQGIYVGPNKSEEHGGVCLFYVNGPFKIHSSYTTTKNCNEGGVYVGVNRADLHGGTCLWNADYPLRSVYTTSKTCRSSSGDVGVYVGANRPDIHGGSCVYIDFP